MILVSVVGDFYSSVLPLFYEFKDKISTHIVIHDDYRSDVIAAKKIINGTLAFTKKYDLNIKSFVIKMDEDSFNAASQVNELIANHVKRYEDLYINITDGLANIGVLLSNEFRAKGANIITYDRYDNEYNLLTLDSMQTYKMQTSIPIKDHLLLKNIEVVSTQNSDFALKHERALHLFFEKYEADRTLYMQDPECNDTLLQKPTGFLYEYYIYNLIKELHFDDILLGVKVKDNRLDDIYLENEYDILIMKDNHLHMIECKYLKLLDVTALLYKLDSVRETLDEDANIMIVSDFDIYSETLNRSNIDISQTYKRAFAKKIAVRGSPTKCVKTFIKDVNDTFILKTDNIEDIYAKKINFSSVKEKERVKMKEEIISFLENNLAIKINFFNIQELSRLLSYRTNKQLSIKTKEMMHQEGFEEFIKLIRKSLQSKQEYISTYDLYDYYLNNLKTIYKDGI